VKCTTLPYKPIATVPLLNKPNVRPRMIIEEQFQALDAKLQVRSDDTPHSAMVKTVPRDRDDGVRPGPAQAGGAQHQSATNSTSRTASSRSHRWFHDNRRSYITNSRRRGIDERALMKPSGHKTRAAFDRYHVVDDSAQREAVRQYEAALLGQETGRR